MMSVKLRLTLIILIPLFLVALSVGYWAYSSTQKQASLRFDDSLFATASAISQDIARSDGDALSLRTRDLINDTSGGQVFYHVYAPDGVFVTGYATPPVAKNISKTQPAVYYNGVYHGQAVRVLRLSDSMQIDGLLGEFNFTVWQETSVLDAFVRDQAQQTFIVIATLTISVGLIVWLGVSIGLRPLLDLQNAISLRSSDDLTPIKRVVPSEVRGIVATLNSLLQQVDDSLKAKNDFISNAAHQLRNPVAGVLAMAEAVKSAPSAETALERTEELYEAALQTSDLANKLLSLDRATRKHINIKSETVLLTDVINNAISSFQSQSLESVRLHWQPPNGISAVRGDSVMLSEAITNLIDNALKHGGDSLSDIGISLSTEANTAVLKVSDNGIGIPGEQQFRALERFGQLNPGRGSGLGLSIVQSVVESHCGTFSLDSNNQGLRVTITLPLAEENDLPNCTANFIE